jgi:nucleoside-diphosphate-sugar epimerase
VSRHLITGGAGFVGSALARRLVEEGHDVTVLDRFSRGKSERIPDGVRVTKGDIRDIVRVRQAVLGQDTVWHLAYVQGTQTFYADPKDVIDVALRGMMNVLEAAKFQQPDLFLVSSSEVYQNPPGFPTDETVPLSVPDVTNPRYSYGGGKIACEIATLAYSEVLRRAVIVRPHNIYGPDMGVDHVIPQFALRMAGLIHTAPMLDAFDPLQFKIQGTGKETRSFCFIDDCIDGLMCLYKHAEDRGVYHLGNPAEEYPIEQVAHFVAAYFGRRVNVIPGELPKGSPTRRLPDITKLADLGYQPKVALPTGLHHTLPWYEHVQQAA